MAVCQRRQERENSERVAPAVDAGDDEREPLGNVIELTLPAAVEADIEHHALGHATLYALKTCSRALASYEGLPLERSATASRAATSQSGS